MALFGDPYGVPMVLEAISPEQVCCLVAASRRPQFVETLGRVAAALGKPLLIQPRSADKDYCRFVEHFRRLSPSVLISNSYSMLVPAEVLTVVRGEAFNVHASLLPRNRGPNPVQWSLIRGENETGVTVHLMTTELDAGDIVAQRVISITETDTWVSVQARLTTLTRVLLRATLPEIVRGNWVSTPQASTIATENTRLTPESPMIDFAMMSDRQVFDLIRAQVHPLSGAYVVTPAGRTYFRELVPLDQIPELRRRFAQDSAPA